MKCKFGSYLTLIAIALTLSAICAYKPQSLFAQDQEPKYTQEEYKAYQDIAAENDSNKKVAMIVAFLKQYPKSELRQHVSAQFVNVMDGLQKNQQWSQIIAVGEPYAALAPDDVFTMSLLTTAYQQTKGYSKVVVFGEKVSAKQPSGNLAYYLAKAYQELGNDQKFMFWGEKTVSLMPDSHEMLVELTRRYAQAKRNAEAGKYGAMCVKAMEKATKPEGTPDNTWNQYKSGSLATCYAVVGNVAYEKNDYGNAIANLEKSVLNYKRNDLAYYYLGLSYWQQNKIDIAMLNLAKAFLLKGNASASAKQHLDNLYKSSHGQSLVGQDRIIARAQQDLK
jgi:tetratricopeptide (TPR) repeat protein